MTLIRNLFLGICISFFVVGCTTMSSTPPLPTVQSVSETMVTNQSETEEPFSTETIIPTPTEVIVTSPTQTPTATLSPIGSGIEEGLLMPSYLPDCELPCWQGLHIGESSKEDVQQALNTVLPLHEPVDFFDGTVSASSSAEYVTALEGYEGGGYSWAGDNMSIDTVFAIDTSSNKLAGVRIQSGSFGDATWSPRTIQDIIEQLGVPDDILALRPLLVTDGTDIYLIYEQEVIFYTLFLLREPAVFENNVHTVRYCLDTKPEAVQDFLLGGFQLSEGQPIFSSPLAQHWLGIFMEERVPSEEAFGLTVEEFAAYAYEDEPCFEVETPIPESP